MEVERSTRYASDSEDGGVGPESRNAMYSGDWKRQGRDFPPELLEGMQLHLDCSPYDLDF